MSSIVLIGPRCVGKTEIGRKLSAELGIPFVDADEQFTETYGTIASFHARYGWSEFRKLETEVLEGICYRNRDTRTVLAPGGGAVAHDQGDNFRNRNVIAVRAFGRVVYLLPSLDLEESASILANREASDPNSVSNRPSLGNVRSLLEKRHPLYMNVAHHIELTGTKSVDDIANTLLPSFRPALQHYSA